MITAHRHRVGTRVLCDAFGEPRASYYRSLTLLAPRAVPTASRAPSFRALNAEEESQVLALLDSPRFCDQAPSEIVATLLDEGTYLCSVRTMYRLLDRHAQSVVRYQAASRGYPCPELVATHPNALWSWDITKLKGPATWTYYYLYKILDVFSRYVVGWLLAYRESAALAEDLIAETLLRQLIQPGTLTIHADRGSAMTSQPIAQLLMDLGVTKTHSRPYVSNDNPFSEAVFKTLKYRPDFPERFGCMEEARAFCQQFFHWYNTDHHHAGIAMLTPASVHYGTYPRILETRRQTLLRAYEAHSERFVKGPPMVEEPPTEVWINKPPIQQCGIRKVS